MAKRYEVTHQSPVTYSDLGQVVQGYLIRGRLTDYNEPFELNVPRLEAEVIDSRVKDLLKMRDQLAQLGEVEDE